MKNNKPSKVRSIFLYINIILLLIVLGAGTYYVVSLYTKAQSCFTVDQVQQSSKCLYIYKTSVYEKGTRAAPHQGNACGSDVTSLIPDSHLLDKVGHLDPNYQGEICANNPIPTDTPSPTATTAPTNTPVPANTTAPTNSPAPTATVTQLNGTTATPTLITAFSPTPTTAFIGGADITTPSATLDPLASETPTPEPTALTTLPVTGRLEWLAVALIPVGLIIAGIVF